VLKLGQDSRQSRRAVHDEIGGRGEARRGLLRGNSHTDDMLEACVGQGSEGIQVCGVVPRVERPSGACLPYESAHRGALVGLHGRTNLEHFAPPAWNQAFGSGATGDLLELRACFRLVASLAEVVGERQALVLHLALHRVAERRDLHLELMGARIELEAVVADVANPAEPHEPSGLLAASTAHEGDEEIPARKPFELRFRRRRHLRELGPGDDRSQRSVHVENERASLWRFPERREQVGRHERENMTVPRALRPRTVYIGIGVAAGFFSALFGVGGGTIVVPLLVLLAGFAPMVATGTSLAAIGITALFGMVAFGVLGEVSWADAVVVGVPAMAGTLAGIWLQQRIASRLLAGLFSVFLLAIAARLFFE
jgi:Sulfite exporter TauE/SafE